MDLQFIPVTGSSLRANSSTQRFIKAHVMRRYKYNQRQARLRERMHPRGSESRGSAPISDSNHLADLECLFSPAENTYSPYSTCSMRDSLETISPDISDDQITTLPDSLLSLGAGSLDPFDTLPLTMTPRLSRLLYHNFSHSIRTSVHADVSGSYRANCIFDVAWLYMNLSHAAARLQYLDRVDSSESTFYLSKSVSAVNNSLSSGTILDTTIATVSCLTNLESLDGQTSNVIIHLDGLRQMVDLRGGLHKLGMDGILRRMVLWSDLLSSIRLKKEPFFPLYTMCQNLPPLPAFTTRRPSHSNPYSLKLSDQLNSFATKQDAADVANMFYRLHELATFLNLTDQDAMLYHAAYPDRVYTVEHSILTLLARLSARLCSLSSIGIIRTLLTAGLLFIYTNLRQTPVGHGIRRRLTERIKSSLIQHTESESLVAVQLPAEILWTTVIAGTAASQQTIFNRHEDEWYSSYIKKICLANGLWSWKEVQGFCECMPVLETSFCQGCEEYWKNFIL